MLIPSIDLMGGRIVQLVQGEKKALEFDNFTEWTERFSPYPLVQLVDLDAAMGKGSNRTLIAGFCRKLTCQVGGGIRSADAVAGALDCGANKVIVGSALVRRREKSEQCGFADPEDEVDTAFARSLYGRFGAGPLVFAVDSRGGRIAIQGWKTITNIEPAAMMQQLEPFCSAFLYTHIDTEGLMRGLPMDIIRDLRHQTSRRLIAAGGIRSREEIAELDAMGVDAVVGMAIYSGLLAP
ncbi:MAG TPA: HisA/HisF-related TIM barrel protein [Candidatus Binatia bacterium]|nr:HisA/HisF-related TIM barrel protein [Candidatus Binatia bacterium]